MNHEITVGMRVYHLDLGYGTVDSILGDRAQAIWDKGNLTCFWVAAASLQPVYPCSACGKEPAEFEFAPPWASRCVECELSGAGIED